MREVPSIPAGLDPKLRNVLSAVRESLNAAITNINLNTDNLAGMRQWIQPALDTSNDLVTFNESLIQASLESATGADGAAGIDARGISLTTPNQSFTYDTNGANPSPASSVITATAVNTAGVVYYEFFVNDVSTGTATTTNTYTYTPQVLFDSMPDKLEVQIREDSITGPIEARDMMTMIGLRAGAHGITVMLSNEAHTLPKTTAGVVTYAGSGTNINVWEGATALTEDSSSPYANSTFRVTNTPTGITPGAITGAGTTTLTYGDSSNMTTDPAKIVFTIIAKREDGTEITVTKQQSLSLSQQGATGGTGDTGGTGATGSRATFTTYATVASAAWNNATAYNAIIAMTGSGGVLLVGDEVTLCYPNTTAPTWVLTQYVTAVGNPGTWAARGKVIDGNLLVTGSVKAAMLQAGVNPLVSGTTMSGQGGIINSDGTFALGNPVVSGVGANISYNGTTMTLNGNVVGTGNIQNDAITSAWTDSMSTKLALFAVGSFNYTHTFASFVMPVAGKLVVTIHGTYHCFNASAGFATGLRVQCCNFVNNSASTVEYPMFLISSAPANANLATIGGTSTAGSSATHTSSEEVLVTAGQSISVSITAWVSAANTSTYLLDGWYVASLYKK